MPRYPQAILVSCEIPWDDNDNLLEDVFRREVREAVQEYNHVYVFGTAGEGYAVDSQRFRRIVEVFYEETRGDDIHPMVGAIGLSTANVIERVAFAYTVGFRTFQIAMPCWGALNDKEVMTYFTDVCGAFPNAQFLHYNLPRTKRVLLGPDYRRLADAVPNLVATKNTGGGLDRAASVMTHAPELQHFFGEANFPHGCMYGECSLLASFAATSPHKTRALFDAGRNGQLAEAFKLQREFHDMLIGVLGPLLAEDRIDGAYDKMLVRFGGFEEMPLRLLSPYQCFTEEQYQACKAALCERFSDWVRWDRVRWERV